MDSEGLASPRVHPRLWRAAPVLALVLPALAIGAAVYAEARDVGGVGEFCRSTAPGTCGMAGNVLVAFLAAAVAYAVLRGWKSRRALRHYVRTAIDEPGKLVRWAPGFQAELSGIRDGVARDIVGVLTRKGPAGVVMVHGRNGAGKTALFLRLTQELPKADRYVLPLPVSLRHAESLDAIGRLARQTFVESVDSAVDSDGDADVIWRWARRTRRLVVLLDDLDDSPAMHPRTREARNKLESEIAAMTRANISVVLATSSDIRWRRLPAMRFALNAVDRRAARAYLAERVGLRAEGDELPERVEAALRAIERVSGDLQITALCDVRRIADLEAAGALPDTLPPQPDRARAVLVDAWLAALCRNAVERDRLSLTRADGPQEVGRRTEAVAAATKVAEAMRAAVSTAPVAPGGGAERALDDAVALALLFVDRGRFGFASKELQAMFIARSTDDHEPLLEAIKATTAEGPWRSDTWIDAGIAWAARHHADTPRTELPDHLLTAAKTAAAAGTPRPRLVAAAARAALVCERSDLFDAVAEAAVLLPPDDADVVARRSIVDTCARFEGRAATKVLWHFALDEDHALVEWEAGNALLNAGGDMVDQVKEETAGMLAAAKVDDAPLADWRSPVAKRVGSLAWVAPSWRDADVLPADLFADATDLCLRMSPLQGEVALARGLKLASMRAAESPASAAEAESLLFGDRPPRTWIARLLIAQALTAEVRRSDDGLGPKLEWLSRQDPHPLVREAAAIGALAARNRELALDRFVWRTERDAVALVPVDAGRMSRLAGDAVLLCNAIYNLAKDDPHAAERLATANALPRCLGRPLDCCDEGCDCGYALCSRRVRAAAVRRRRAPLTAAFCLEQERRLGRLGSPPWDGRWPRRPRTRDRRRYWHDLAAIASGG